MKLALCMMAALMAALPLTAQTPGYAAASGPLPVSSEEYKFAGAILPTIAYPVDVWAKVWYPEGLPQGPYPLVLLMHGNHGICRLANTQLDSCPPVPPTCPAPFQQTPQHAGYDYVAERLASHGYIVASINANAINCRANAIPERGRLVQEHLRRWGQWNGEAGAAPFGTRFSGKVNLQNIGLMGHSRGGEGVLAAYNFNRQENGPFGIKAVFEISPVDFGRNLANPVFNADGVAFSVVLSGCDFDVLDNQGMRVFDRAMYLPEPGNPSIKSQQYVWGVNHNYFNTEWTTENTLFGCTDLPIITTRAPQQEVGAVYLMAFMRMVLGGEDYKNLFTGDGPPPPSVAVPVDIAFTESPSATLMVDNFSDAKAPAVNLLGGPNSAVNLDINACSGSTAGGRALCGIPPLIWFHDPGTVAAKIEWPAGQAGITPALAVKLSADGSAVDVSKYRYLSFRVAVEFDGRNPANPGTQDFSVQLKMGTTSTSAVAAAKYRNIPFPAGLFRKSVMKTIRIPLADFTGLDRAKLSEIDFIFDRVKTGAIFLGDIEFTP